MNTQLFTLLTIAILTGSSSVFAQDVEDTRRDALGRLVPIQSNFPEAAISNQAGTPRMQLEEERLSQRTNGLGMSVAIESNYPRIDVATKDTRDTKKLTKKRTNRSTLYPFRIAG